MTRNGKIILVVVVIAILAAGAWGFGLFDHGAATVEEEPVLRYIVNNLNDITTIDIALEKGFFEEEGIKVENVGVAGGGAASIQAIASGSADIGNAAMPAYVNSIAAGTKIKVIYGGPAMAHAGDPGYQLIVREDSGINSARDLVGKTIAMGARGAMWEYSAREYLRQAGLSVDQVTILIVPPPQHEQVLKSSQVDVVVGGQPIADNILEGGGTRALTNLYNILGEKGSSYGFGSIVRQDLIEKNPELVKKLVATYVKTDQWTEANPEEARKIVAAILEKREQNPVIAKYWKPIHLANYGQLSDENVQYWLDWFIQDGKIKEGEIKPSDVYTNEFNPYYK
ncbi:MAG TPA: hypothetical protein DCZ10_03245 [Pelotomaculum sp.]|nr:hypothetical protein [Pelotomaculum sp.]